MKKFALSGADDLKEEEMLALNGGSFLGWLKSGLGWAIASSIISNWGDIREGFSDGYNQVPPRW